MSDWQPVADAIQYAAEAMRREAVYLDRLSSDLRSQARPGPALSAISAIAQVPHLCRPASIADAMAEAMAAEAYQGEPPRK